VRASRRTAAIAAAVAALVVALVLARSFVESRVIGGVLTLATGYQVGIGGAQLGTSHAVFRNVHVRKNGDPVLDAARVDVDYALRDVFPGGAHRYGFAALAIQAPTLTITRHADGTMTFNRSGGTTSETPAGTRAAAAPYYFTVRVRDGIVRLVDAAPLEADLAEQRIEHVTIDASVKSDARTNVRLDGTLVGRTSQGAALGHYPLAARALIDVHRGIAIDRIRADRLPLRGVLAFLLHSKALHLDDGTVDRVAVDYDGLQPVSGGPFTYRLGGTVQVSGARLGIGALEKPIRDLNGPLVLAGDTIAATAITANLSGIPLRGHGGIYNIFAAPALWFGVAADGDLAQLRSLFTVSKKLPLSGRLHVETLLGGRLSNLLIRNHFSGSSLYYGKVPVRDLDGIADIGNNGLLVHDVAARYGDGDVTLGGRVDFGTGAGSDLLFAAGLTGSGQNFPYTNLIAPDARIAMTALVAQAPHGPLDARGTLAVAGATNGAGTFALDSKGVGEFGPFIFARSDGTSLAGAFELERPISESAGWITAHEFALADVRTVQFPGLNLPQLPPLAGVIDGSIVAGGTPDAFGISGLVHGRGMRIDGYAIGDGDVRLGGTFRDVRLANIALHGPLGRFNGDAAFGGSVFALEGEYDGDLAMLQPFTGSVGAHGGVHGPVRAAIGAKTIAIQTAGLVLDDASVHGIPVERIAGTLLVRGKQLRLIAADAEVGGGRVLAGDTGGPFFISAQDVPAAALHGAGLPLQAGTLSVLGTGDIRQGVQFEGGVALRDGRVDGVPISGGGEFGYRDATATISRGIAALGATYGSFDGSVNGIGQGPPAFDLNAHVPLGDVAEVRTALHLPSMLRTLNGSFTADVRVHGAGSAPRIDGNVQAPEGSYNGLDFSEASASIAASPTSFSASNGGITVGSTRARVAASGSAGAFAVHVSSTRADLADFDDYFDTAETLAGTGRIAFALSNDGRTTRTTGDFAVSGLRYRSFAFGDSSATWSQRGPLVQTAAAVTGAHGTLRVNGTVAPASGDLPRAFAQASYNGTVVAGGVDLGTWLPALSITAPILGEVDGSARVAGRWPRLVASGAVDLHRGSVFGHTVTTAHVGVRTDGERISLLDGSADLGFATFTLGGSLGIDPRAPLALSVGIATPDVHRAYLAVEPKGMLDIAGALSANAAVTGTFAAPRASLGFELIGGRYKTLTVPRVLGSVGYDGKIVQVHDIEATFAKGSVGVSGTLPFGLQPFGVSASAPLSFNLAFDALDLAPFALFVPGTGTKLGGTVDGRLAIEGTRSSPRVVGDLALANGSYVSSLDRDGVTKANATLAFTGTSVTLRSLQANLGNGTLDGSGQLDLPFPGVPASGFAIALNAHGAKVDSPQFGRGTIDGTMRLQKSGALPVLAGDITLSNASIPVSAITKTASSSGGSAGSGPPFNLAFDLTAHAGKNVRVQSSIVNVGAVGSLAITGTLNAPKLDGRLTATPGGVFSTYNHAFRIQQATITFNPDDGVDPYIDMRAFAHVSNPDPDPTRNAVGSADITVTVHGTADELASGAGNVVSFSSNPPYGDAEIVGLLLDASLFGAVNFNQSNDGTYLRGAPGPSNVLLLPGGTVYQAATTNFNQEAFSVLNGQLTQRFLAPVETLFTGALGLSDFELTVDYGGGVGYELLKQIGHRDLYANFGQTLSYPGATTFGLTARPDATTSAVFNYFQQRGVPAFTTTFQSTIGETSREKGFLPLDNRTGFTFTIVRKYP
jgi:hypothetical protein